MEDSLKITGPGSNLSSSIPPYDLLNVHDTGFLSLVIVIGSSLSLVGLVFAFITYSLFSDLRGNSGTIIMNLLASLFITQLLYVIGSGGIQAIQLCVTLMSSLLYARISVIFWLLAASIDLYKMVKTNCGLCRQMPSTLSSTFKYYFVGWCVPTIPLAFALFFQFHLEGLEGEKRNVRLYNCWFPSYYTFLLAFLVPCLVGLSLCCYFLLRSLLIIRWTATLFVNKSHQKLTLRNRVQLLLFIRICAYIFLVVSSAGISIIFDSPVAWIVFTCTSALQGFIVALSVTCNCEVLKLYSRSLRFTQPGVNYSFGNEITKSSSLQLLAGEPLPGTV